MRDPQQVAQIIQATFEQIYQQNMRDIPIVNQEIQVEAVGFQPWQDRMLGIVITPWMMNLVLLPADGEDWSDMQLGDKRPHEFPSGTYKFMANDIEGIGPCQTHSLYSPMREFVSHQQALRIAEDFLAGLFEESELSEEDRVDEELLGRVMRGEVTPEIDFDRFDEFAPMQAGVAPVRGDSESSIVVENKISRRDLLRGELKG